MIKFKKLFIIILEIKFDQGITINIKGIYLQSENDKIINELKDVLNEYYKINLINKNQSCQANSIIIDDLTNYDIINNNQTYEKNLKFLSKNIKPIAIINNSQISAAETIINLKFEDFIIYPFIKFKIIATLNNIMSNIENTIELNKIYQIGIELSSEKNLDELLKKILSTCCDITSADGGSIYTILPGIDPSTKNKMLIFQYSQSDTLGNIYEKFTIPINVNSISGYVALNKKILNIDDCYNIPENSEYKFYDNFDKANNYKTKSMMTVPMINHIGDIIGVVQLINRKTKKKIIFDSIQKVDDYVIEFDKNCERIIQSLASQAGISIENTMLYKELKDIFDKFIEASALAVESRDPTTAGHSRRVSILSVALAREINRIKEGPFANINFTDDQVLSIRYAALLHDFGKIGVKEYVLTKSEKLLLCEFQIIKERFETIRYHISSITNNEDEKKEVLLKIEEYFKLLEKTKVPGKLTDAEKNTLKMLNKLKYITAQGELKPYLTDEELKSYLVENGSLTDEEKEIIRKHVFYSFNFLDEIPWPSTLKTIPRIAFSHHEQMDGTGYPNNLKENDIPLEAQILGAMDIFDALIAKDRPYKKKIKINEALNIITKEAEKGKLNKNIVELFIKSKIYEKYNF